MEHLRINKTFKTREEMEKYAEELRKEYIVMMVVMKEQTVGEPDIYGIDEIIHFGKR